MLETPSRLHHQLIKFGSQYSEWADIRHLGVMCWMIVGLIGEGSVNLTSSISAKNVPHRVYCPHTCLGLNNFCPSIRIQTVPENSSMSGLLGLLGLFWFGNTTFLVTVGWPSIWSQN